MKAYVLINTTPGHAIDVATRLQAFDGVTAADAITGEYDVIAVCETADIKSTGALAASIGKVEGVLRTITNLSVH